MLSDKSGSGEYWINNPTAGSLYRTLATAAGGAAPPTARKVTLLTNGDLYLIPVGDAAGAGVLRKAGCLAGEVHIVQHDGLGSDSTCTVLTDF